MLILIPLISAQAHGCLPVLVCERVLIARLALPHTRSSWSFQPFPLPTLFWEFCFTEWTRMMLPGIRSPEIIDTRSECCSQEIQHTWELCAAQPRCCSLTVKALQHILALQVFALEFLMSLFLSACWNYFLLRCIFYELFMHLMWVY